MIKVVKYTLICLILGMTMPNFVHAFDIDETVDDEIRKNYNPTKNTILSFAIALELTLQETQTLLATAGYILSKSSLFDVIIMYCILKGIYDVLEIDSILFQYDQPTLFFKE